MPFTRPTRDAYCRCYDEMMLAADAELSEQYSSDFATEPAITEQYAVELAEQNLTALGIAGMKPLTCSRMCVYGSVGDIVGRGWAVTFTWDCGGLTVPYDLSGSSGNVNDVPALSAPWGQEVLTVGVDSAGICYFTLKGACTVTKKLYANVPLLDYDKLLDRIENQLFYHHAFSADGVKNPCITVPRYIAGKAVGCAVSGGLTLALGIFIAYGFAALTDSKYMAYASPFVLFYLLIILYERYFDKLFVLYPREWLNPSPRWVFGKIGVAVLLTEFSLLMALAFFATPCAKWTREL